MFVAEVINVAKSKRTAKGLCGQHPQSIGIFVIIGSVEGPRSPDSFELFVDPLSIVLIRNLGMGKINYSIYNSTISFDGKILLQN